MDLLSISNCHCKSLCFVWQGSHKQTDRGFSSTYYSRQPVVHPPEKCARRCPLACSENFCELMNTLQKMSSLPMKVITPENKGQHFRLLSKKFVFLFDIHVAVHRDKFLIIKPTRCTNFSNLFLNWNSTCFGQFLCPSSGVFHCTGVVISP